LVPGVGGFSEVNSNHASIAHAWKRARTVTALLATAVVALSTLTPVGAAHAAVGSSIDLGVPIE